MSSVDARIREFCAQQREWLEQELHEEQDEAAAVQEEGSKKSKSEEDDGRTARVLSQLEASEISVGLYGRTVVQLSRRRKTTADSSSSSAGEGPSSSNDSMLLPAHRFTTGDEVEIRSKSAGNGSSSGGGAATSTGGVVNEVTDTSISVALFSGGRRGNKSQQNQKQKQQSGGGSKQNNNNTTSTSYSATTDEDGGLGNPPYALLPTSSIEVHKKLIAALDELEKHGIDHPTAGHVVKALFQREEEVMTPPPKKKTLTNENTNGRLDPSQLEAIEFALADNRPVALVHGPPGTGKTTTIVELIRQAVTQHGMRVLVAAPSNVAVDNVLERLVATPTRSATTTTDADADDLVEEEEAEGDDDDAKDNTNKAATSSKVRRRDVRNNKKTNTNKKKLKVVRLGHPARLQAGILPYSLEALVQSADGTEVVADARQELQSLLRLVSKDNNKSKKKGGGGGGDYRKRAAAYREIKLLRQEVRQREEQVVQELLKQANVVLATCVGAANRLLSGNKKKDKDKTGLTFDLVVIDEAAQALEAACWIPALRAGLSGKLVLAGDHCQLPPTIKSHRPQVVQGLSKTMFERLMELYGDDLNSSDNSKNDKSNETKVSDHGPGRVSRMLRTQYRMHQNISDWSSNALYGGQLQTHKSVASRTLAQLGASNGDSNNTETNKDGDDSDGVSQTALLLIDTAGCGMYEQKNEAGSRSNEMEGQIVAQHVRKLLALGVQQEQIAVITPYNGQVELLRTMLLPEAPKLEIRSVDGFQGGEREAVVLSLVRSSERGGMDGIGFLRDDRRLNVAVTRAKRHCCVVCDSETVSQSAFVQGLVQWMEEHGESRSALEYMSSEGNTDFQVQSDLAMADQEIQRLMRDVATAPPKAKKPTTQTKSDSQRKDVEEMRKGLLEKVGAFAKKGTPGDKMTLNAELSSYDRRLVHELAEELGIDHCSEGVEGVDRRIILSIPQEETAATAKVNTITAAPETSVVVSSSPASNDTAHDDADESEGTDEEPSMRKGASCAFAVLDDADHDSDDEEAAPGESKNTPEPSMNNLLGSLAKDRAQRHRQAAKASSAAAVTATSQKPMDKKKKGQKLGGAQKKAPPKKQDKDDGMDDLDDMAFLDAQIDKVQNAHGRKLDAKGKGYRTVMNGILNSTPQPEAERKRDARSAAALQTKLKAAQDGRKSKPKKKK